MSTELEQMQAERDEAIFQLLATRSPYALQYLKKIGVLWQGGYHEVTDLLRTVERERERAGTGKFLFDWQKWREGRERTYGFMYERPGYCV